MMAATDHSPIEKDTGKKRYVIYALTHIGLDKEGRLGKTLRVSAPGTTMESSACGALLGFLGELERGSVQLLDHHADAEQTFLKRRLIPLLKWGKVPSLVEVTAAAHNAIESDLDDLLKETVATWRAAGDRSPIDIGVFTGTQVHGPGFTSFIHPGSAKWFEVEAGKQLPDEPKDNFLPLLKEKEALLKQPICEKARSRLRAQIAGRMVGFASVGDWLQISARLQSYLLYPRAFVKAHHADLLQSLHAKATANGELVSRKGATMSEAEKSKLLSDFCVDLMKLVA